MKGDRGIMAIMALPTVIIPGYFARDREYFPMVADLGALGIEAVVVPLTLSSWFPTLGGKPVTPILEAIATTINKIGSPQVNLVGHSAGGWIARILMGEHAYVSRRWGLYPLVKTLVTLGTPHLSQERFTRDNMEFVNRAYPGAYHPEVRYVCLAAKAVYGPDNWFARQSYALTCGWGNCWGDGITPITAAHLLGAENLVLENVLHSPRGGRRWYGSADVLPQWVGYMRE